MLAICHTIRVNKAEGERYQASSPDEFCFIKYCEKLGIVYLGDQKDPSNNGTIRVVDFKGRQAKFVLLDVLEFDATRKRMSVIVRDTESGQIVMFCKGADMAVLKNCTSGDIQTCDRDLRTFAEQGWRTLVLAYKHIRLVFYF